MALPLLSLVIGFLLWGCSAFRHYAYQSTAFDLGIYDQVAWLISRGLEAKSTLLDLHHIGNHGAYLFYFAGFLYWMLPSVNWLLATQAFSLSFTALPLIKIWKQKSLPLRFIGVVPLLWFLQPQVFNTNLWDFHPDVWAMPAFALAIWASREKRRFIWLSCIFWILGCRDGYSLLILGLGLTEIALKNYKWGLLAIGIGTGWIFTLSEFIFPLFNDQAGPAALARFSALGDNMSSVVLSILFQPWKLLSIIDWPSLPAYILFICISTFLFWRKSSIPILLSAVPLIFVNILSESATQRNLIYHYNLPLAVIFVVAAIDGLSEQKNMKLPWRRLLLLSFCWASFAKPGYFAGKYLRRLPDVLTLNTARGLIEPTDRVLTTNYLAPHLTHRKSVDILQQKHINNNFYDFNTILINPKDPGGSGSSSELQTKAIEIVEELEWKCSYWDNGLTFCKD